MHITQNYIQPSPSSSSSHTRQMQQYIQNTAEIFIFVWKKGMVSLVNWSNLEQHLYAPALSARKHADIVAAAVQAGVPEVR